MKLVYTNEGLPRVVVRHPKHTTRYPIDELVAKYFMELGQPDDILIHRDGDLLNNAYHNLQYVSKDEYMEYVWEIPKYPGVKWKAVRGFSRYLASDRGGMILNGEFGYLMSQHHDEEGYYITSGMPDVKKKKKSVSRQVHLLVADAWLPKEPGKDYVDHINKHRKDNDVTNLRWVTYRWRDLETNPVGYHGNHDTIRQSEKCGRGDGCHGATVLDCDRKKRLYNQRYRITYL